MHVNAASATSVIQCESERITMKTFHSPKKLIMILSFFVILTTIKILFVGYDIDEQYAVSMSYRLLRGDFPLLDMWEPHQTSCFLCALLMIPYLSIFQTTTGIILYLRICGLLFHALTAFLLYKLLRENTNRKCCVCLCCIYFFSLPKLMFLPEFSNMQIWFLMLTIFCLLKYYTPNFSRTNTRPLTYLVFGGFFMALEVLTYPSTILAFLFLLIFMVFRRYTLLRELAAFILPCIASAIIFFIYLLSRMSLDELLMLLPMAASDGSHSASLTEKLFLNISSLETILISFLVYAALAALLHMVRKKIGGTSCQKKIRFTDDLLLVTLLMQVAIWLFGSHYPNYPLVEYFFIPIIAVFSGIRRKQTSTPVFTFFVMVPMTAFLGIVLFTNHPLLVSAPFMTPCLIGGLLLLLTPTVQEKNVGDSALHTEAPRTNCIGADILLLWVIVLLFGRFYMIRTTGGQHYTIYNQLSLIRQGPAMGIIADTETVRKYKNTFQLLEENLPEGAKVFYAGTSSGLYLMKDMEFCTPSTISSPTFDEKIMKYFDLRPDKQPEYVICDADLPDLYTNSWLAGYLQENCMAEPVFANDYLLIYKLID